MQGNMAMASSSLVVAMVAVVTMMMVERPLGFTCAQEATLGGWEGGAGHGKVVRVSNQAVTMWHPLWHFAWERERRGSEWVRVGESVWTLCPFWHSSSSQRQSMAATRRVRPAPSQPLLMTDSNRQGQFSQLTPWFSPLPISQSSSS
jgi:hypothetical protein